MGFRGWSSVIRTGASALCRIGFQEVVLQFVLRFGGLFRVEEAGYHPTTLSVMMMMMTMVMVMVMVMVM